MKLFWLILLLFPFFAFCAAGIMELRSDRSLGAKLGTLGPPLLGIGAFAIACGLNSVLHLAANSFVANGRAMAMSSAIIASSGAFISYSRKSSGILIALGALELVFFFTFFNEPIV